MYKISKVAAVIGVAFALTPWAAFAQTPDSQSTQVDQPKNKKHDVKLADEPVASPTPADQQPTKEQLAKLFEAMRVRKQMQSMLKMMPTMVQQQIQAQFKQMAPKAGLNQPTSEQQAAIDKIMSKYMEKALSVVTIDQMLDDVARPIYERHVSHKDVDAMIAFYTSPAGQHLLDTQPVIMQEYVPLVMKRAQESSEALSQEMMNDIQEIVKLAAAPADKPAAK